MAMPWGTLKVPPTTEMEVIPDNGKRYVVTFRAGESYLPLHIFNYLLFKGLIVPGDKPDPKPQWTKGPNNSHGAAISVFAPYVREVTQ
jgi:hypothetical protein